MHPRARPAPLAPIPPLLCSCLISAWLCLCACVTAASDFESFLVDLGSATGSYVDGQRAEKGPDGKPMPLKDGSVITLGDSANTYTFRVRAPSAEGGVGGKNAGKRKR